MRMKRLAAALLASTVIALHPARAASLALRADGLKPAVGTSGCGIYAFSGANGFGCFDGAAANPGAVPILPIEAPWALKRTGDTVQASLFSFVLNGAPAYATTQQMLAVLGAFYANGGFADGGHHLLSGITSFNGVNTTGYTLAQWQSLFAQQVNPTSSVNPVTALTNEADEVAIQAMVNTTGSVVANQALQVPPGFLWLTHPIQSGCFPIKVQGAGKGMTFLYESVQGQDGWHHGTSETACPAKYNATFEMRDLTLATLEIGGTALYAVQNGGGFRLENMDVALGSLAGRNYWHDGIHCTNCSNANFNNVDIRGAIDQPGVTGIGLNLDTTGAGAGNFGWMGGNVTSFNTCFSSASGGPNNSGTPADIEGLFFYGLNAGGCNTIYQTAGPPGQAAQYYVHNSQFGPVNTFINMAQEAEVKIDGSLVYANPLFTYGGTTVTSGGNTISFPNGLAGATGTNVVGSVIGDVYGLYPANTIVTAVSGSGTSFQATLNNNATGGGSEPVSFRPVSAFTANETSGNTVLTNVSSLAGLQAAPGNYVFGPNLPTTGSKIVSVDAIGSTVTLATAPTANATSASLAFRYAPPSPLMTFTNDSDLYVANNILLMAGGHNSNYVGYFAGDKVVTIRDNIIYDYGPTLSNYWADGGGNTLLKETGTIVPLSQSYVGSVFNALGSGTGSKWGLFYAGYGCNLGTSNLISCTKSYASTLSSSLEVTVGAAAGFPPVFTSVPQIDAINGDVNSVGSFCGAEASGTNAPTTTGFTAKCPAGAAGNAARINYTATGQ